MTERVGIEIYADTSNARREIDRLSRSLNGLRRSGGRDIVNIRNVQNIRINVRNLNREIRGTGRELSLLFKIWKGFFAIEVIKKVVDSAIQFITLSEAITLAQARLDALTDSSRESAEAFSNLTALARETGTELDTSIQVFNRLKLTQKDLKVTTEQMLDFVDVVQKLGVIGGTSNKNMRAGLTQLGQGLSAGILRAEEFNSTVENLPLIVKTLADNLGVNQGKLREMVITGKVLSKDVFKAILVEQERVDEMFNKMPVTFSRASNEMSIAIQQLAKAVDDETGLSAAVNRWLKGVTNRFDQIRIAMGNATVDEARELRDLHADTDEIMLNEVRTLEKIRVKLIENGETEKGNMVALMEAKRAILQADVDIAETQKEAAKQMEDVVTFQLRILQLVKDEKGVRETTALMNELKLRKEGAEAELQGIRNALAAQKEKKDLTLEEREIRKEVLRALAAEERAMVSVVTSLESGIKKLQVAISAVKRFLGRDDKGDTDTSEVRGISTKYLDVIRELEIQLQQARGNSIKVLRMQWEDFYKNQIKMLEEEKKKELLTKEKSDLQAAAIRTAGEKVLAAKIAKIRKRQEEEERKRRQRELDEFISLMKKKTKLMEEFDNLAGDAPTPPGMDKSPTQLIQEDMERKLAGESPMVQAIISDFDILELKIKSTGEILAETFSGIGVNALDSFSNGMADIIVKGNDAKEVFHGISQTIATEMVSSLIKLASRQAINFAFEKAGILAVTQTRTIADQQEVASHASKVAAKVALNTTENASLATGAMFTSIKSFGIAAALGIAGFIAAKQIANRAGGGSVQGGQVVGVNETGRPETFTTNDGRQYLVAPNGGGSISQTQGASQGGLNSSFNQDIIINNESGAEVEVTRSDRDVVAIAVRAVREDFKRNMESGYGDYFNSMKRHTNIKRRI